MVWLAIDLGTTGVKVALLQAGTILKSAYRDYPTYQRGGVIEQSVTDWWQATCAAVRDLGANSVDAVALTGQMQDLILLDNMGEPVRSTILYSDTRAGDEASWVNKTLGRERLREITGNEQTASSLLAKLRWLSKHEPESLARARHLLLGAADYLAFKMTGVAACDTTTASTTGLLELATRDWLAHDSLARLELAETVRLLPEVVAGGAEVGRLTPEGAAALGLPAGLPIHLGPGDAGATTLGAGGGEPGRPYAYVGTSGWVAYSAEVRAAPDTGVFTLAHPDPGLFICVAPLLTAGGNFDWARELFGADTHASLMAEALKRPFADLIYLPYLKGERAPFTDPHARGAFVGLSPNHTRADLARAVLEGVAFAYRHALEALVSAPASLTITGGGARSTAFCRLLADVTGLQVEVLDEASETGLRGAVLAALQARAEPKVWPQRAAVLEPDRALGSRYGRKYVWFREAYTALKSLFTQMAATD